MKPSSFIVGVGASAGGLEALKSFFDHVPPSCRHTFVVVQHLSPDYKSLMAELLAKNTDLPIQQVVNDQQLQPGTVYLIPPKKNLTLREGRLILEDKPKGGELNLPIDIFFRSLADEQDDRAIGIVLSGTGSDGTRGLRAIKEAGGMIMAQEPQQAKFDGMPGSAIRTGLVDYVLPVEKMGDSLVMFIDHFYDDDGTPRVGRGSPQTLTATMERILALVKKQEGIDFKPYKALTLGRRIERRRLIKHCESLEDYLTVLYEEPAETKALVADFLIGVTKFIRDPEKWQVLVEQVLPALVREKKESGEPLRCWSVACSTGEEVYTLAILLAEEMERQQCHVNVKVFATDLLKSGLATAAKGVYAASVAADLPSPLVEKYFHHEHGDYRISESIRGMVLFSHHNILRDPPFNRMDLVLCRNALIYFQPEAQQKAISVLHYALHVGGTLFLGSSETVGDLRSSFDEIDGRAKIYRNKKASRMPGIDFRERTAPTLPPQNGRHRQADDALAQAFSKTVTEQLGVAAVYITDTFEILKAEGDVRQYIALPTRGFSANFAELLPPLVGGVVRQAVRNASAREEKVVFTDVSFELDGTSRVLDVIVTPIASGPSRDACFLVLLLPNGREPVQLKSTMEVGSDNHAHVAELEEELRRTRENLQATLEEAETTNEELQATNEELLASNEELQSTNEELQSVNEELHTVNAEHQQKISDLNDAYADMDNLLRSTEIGTIFLDRALNIRKFTPAAQAQFNLRDVDISRPLKHFTHVFVGEPKERTIDIAKTVMTSGEAVEDEVQTSTGAWLLRRVHPFRKQNTDEIDGVVLSFIDISPNKEIQERYRFQNLAFEQVLEGTMAGYWDWNIPADTEYLSPSFKKMFGYEDHEMENTPDAWQKIIHQDDLPGVFETFNAHVESHGKVPYDSVVRYWHKEGHIVWVYCRGKVIVWGKNGEPVRMVGSHVDVTALKRAETLYQEQQDAFAQVLRGAKAGTVAFTAGVPRKLDRSMELLLGYREGALHGREGGLLNHVHAEDGAGLNGALDRFLAATSGEFEHRARLLRADGSVAHMYITAHAALRTPEGTPHHVMGCVVDVSADAIAHMRLEEERVALERVLRTAHAATWEYLPAGATAASDSLCTQLGFSTGELNLTAQSFARLVYPEDRENVLRVMDDLTAGIRDVTSLSFRFRNAAGEPIWVNFDARVGERDAEGTATRILCCTADVSAAKAAVASLARSNQALAQFAYAASHDLQEPLRTITNFADLLHGEERDRLSEDGQEWLSFVLEGSRRMRELVIGLLDYSRVGQSNQREEVSISTAVDDVLKDLKGAITEAEATVDVGALPTVLGVPLELRMLLQNLISNALKFRAKTRPLRVTVRGEALSEAQWMFSIADNGIGIAPEHRQRIFEVFQRLHRKDEYPGTGIGPAQCKRIAEGHGGRIWCDSVEGEGTNFFFTVAR